MNKKETISKSSSPDSVESKIIYVPDTNVLVDSFIFQTKSFNKWNRPKNCEWAYRFLFENQNKVIVPDLVFAEFLGVTIHKDIEVSGSLNKTKKILSDKHSVIKQYIRLLKDPKKDVELFFWPPPGEVEKSKNLYNHAFKMVSDHRLIDQEIYKYLHSKHLYNQKNNKDYSIKLLDGMDSVIVSYVNEIAHQYPRKLVCLLTADKPVEKVFNPLKKLFKSWFVDNTLVLPSRLDNFKKIICSEGHKNGIDILLRKNLTCSTCDLPLLS